jgi:hypothetical protein
MCHLDPANLSSLGLVLRESDGRVGADMGPFVFVEGSRGYLEFSTDFDLSSHLVEFRLDAVEDIGPQLFVAVSYAVPALAYAARSDALFVPDGGGATEGHNCSMQRQESA